MRGKKKVTRKGRLRAKTGKPITTFAFINKLK